MGPLVVTCGASSHIYLEPTGVAPGHPGESYAHWSKWEWLVPLALLPWGLLIIIWSDINIFAHYSFQQNTYKDTHLTVISCIWALAVGQDAKSTGMHAICYRLNCVSQKNIWKSQLPVSPNVTLYENRVIEDEIGWHEVMMDCSGPRTQYDWCP